MFYHLEFYPYLCIQRNKFMATVIYPSPIFGPVHSRRLGVSLGINLLPADGKVRRRSGFLRPREADRRRDLVRTDRKARTYRPGAGVRRRTPLRG